MSPWTLEQWNSLETQVRRTPAANQREAACRSARKVLRSFSSSFFLVTRFLPPKKREQVELIYAAVRYPDEVVDSFPLSANEKLATLTRSEYAYRQALALPFLRTRVSAGVPWILAGFAEVVR